MVHQWVVFFMPMETFRRLCGLSSWSLDFLPDRPGQRSLDNGLLASVPMEPALESEGLLWNPSLLGPDPTFLLPIILAQTLLLKVSRLHAQIVARGFAENSLYRPWMLRSTQALVLLTVPVTLQLPAAFTGQHLPSLDSSIK